MGKIICSASMNFKAHIPIIHLKSWAWLPVPITIVLIGKDRYVPRSLMACQTLPHSKLDIESGRGKTSHSVLVSICTLIFTQIAVKAIPVEM